MINRPLSARAKREQEKKRLIDVKRRYLSKNVVAQKFCNDNGLTVYASAQAYNETMVKLFRQRGEDFLPLSEKLYNQTEPQEVMEYCAAIDMEYERIYKKMKDKI